MSSDETPKGDIYIFAQRSSAEVERLNWQHNYIVRCMGGHLIHPSIPIDEIASIADVACGTGVWLEDVSKALSASGTERSYEGFDISPKMFPPESERGKIKFEVLDIMKPVPEEYHARFDLVSIRLLCAAIKEVDLGYAIRNAEQMIKPGGYLQWVELGPGFIPDIPQYPKMHEVYQKIKKFWAAAGYSPDVPTVLMEEASPSLKLTLKRYDYHWTATSELVADSARFFELSLTPTIAVTLYKTQEAATMEEAAKKTQDVLESIKDVPKEELLAGGKWSALISQKQLE